MSCWHAALVSARPGHCSRLGGEPAGGSCLSIRLPACKSSVCQGHMLGTLCSVLTCSSHNTRKTIWAVFLSCLTEEQRTDLDVGTHTASAWWRCEAPPSVADSRSHRLALVWEKEGRGRLKTLGDILSIFSCLLRSHGAPTERCPWREEVRTHPCRSLVVLAAAVRERVRWDRAFPAR